MSAISCIQCGAASMRPVHSFAEFEAALAADDRIRRSMLDYMRANPDSAFESIVECGQCGVRRIHPMPSADVLGRFYTHYAGNSGYAKRLDSKIRRTRKRLTRLRRLVVSPQPTFLDVGCNLGSAVEAARQMGFTATGIEIGQDSVDRARELFPRNRFFATTVEAFAEQGEQFDFVFTTEVIEHVTDPALFARSLARLVKPGGVLFLTTPDAGHWRRPKDFLAWNEVKPPEHVSWQNKRSLTHLFRQAGFQRMHFRRSLKPGIRMVAGR